MTEMITGLDLIQEQVRAAQGEVLRWKQEDIKIKVPGQSLSDTLPEEFFPGLPGAGCKSSFWPVMQRLVNAAA